MTKNNSEAQASFAIEETTIEKIRTAFQTGQITIEKLTRQYLDRIEKYDRNGPGINAVFEINPDVLDIAAELDQKRRSQESPLYGIPVLLKGNISTADQLPTNAGAAVLANNFAAEDAFLVKKLRKAGAVVLGKVNLSEFANFVSYNLPNGFSFCGGQVLNPYGPGSFDVGGSSSGTGAAIAANFAAVGIGTETSGSILNPSSSNSIVGIKPTLGLISRSGIIPLAPSQDTAGPMTRTVADAAAVLTVIAGHDLEDEATAACIGKVPEDYSIFLNENGLKGARIGIDRSAEIWMSDQEKLLMNEAVEVISAQGGTVIDPVEIPQLDYSLDVLRHEFKHHLNAYLKSLPQDIPVRSLSDIIAYNKAHPEVIPYGQDILESAQKASDDPFDPAYLKKRRHELLYAGKFGIDTAIEEHDLDAVFSPKSFRSDMAAKAGYPSITVPAGYTEAGEPFGITFTAKAYEEPVLIQFAYAYEQATQKRIPPVLK